MELIHGDCLEVMKSMKEASVDLILCDLPQGVTACDWDIPIPFDALWAGYRRVLKPDGVCVLFGNQPFTAQLVCSNPKWYRFEMIWEKSKASGFLNARRRPMAAHEAIEVFSPRAPKYFPQMTAGKPYSKGKRKAQTGRDLYGQYNQVEVKSEGLRFPRSVLYYPTAESERALFPCQHKSQKPQRLLQWLIKTYSAEGATVFDSCMGSGATGVASIYTGREFLGIEQDADFFGKAKGWIEREAAKFTERSC